MFDIGWSELVLIGVVALIAIGPIAPKQDLGLPAPFLNRRP